MAAFPYDFEENFEDGTFGSFNSSTGGDGTPTVVHYVDQVGKNGVLPWQGAYMAKFDISGTATQYVSENEGFDLAADAEDFCKFNLYLEDLTLSDGESVTLFNQLATATDEGTIVLRNNSGVYEVGVNEPTGTAAAYGEVPLNRWFQLELGRVLASTGTASDGSLTLWVDDTQVATIGSLDQGPVTTANLGVVSSSNANNTGTIWMDRVVITGNTSPARIGGRARRYPHHRIFTIDEHIVVGPGRMENLYVTDAGSGDVGVRLYDTDEAEATDDRLIAEISAPVASSTEEVRDAIRFSKGLYVVPFGTNPRGAATLGRVVAYGSEGSIRRYGRRRKTGLGAGQ